VEGVVDGPARQSKISHETKRLRVSGDERTRRPSEGTGVCAFAIYDNSVLPR
jgi:hypothetical protein